MKKIIMFLMICSILFSCKKEEVLPEAPMYAAGSKEFGNAKGLKNGKDFESSVFVVSNPNKQGFFFIGLTTEESPEVFRETFTCTNIPLAKGTYKKIKDELDSQTTLNDLASHATTFIGDGCLVDDQYSLDIKADNYIKVTSIDTEKKRIKGEVDLRYNIVQPQRNPANAAILHLKKVTFDAVIQ